MLSLQFKKINTKNKRHNPECCFSNRRTGTYCNKPAIYITDNFKFYCIKHKKLIQGELKK